MSQAAAAFLMIGTTGREDLRRRWRRSVPNGGTRATDAHIRLINIL